MKKNKLYQWENNKPHEIDFLYNFLKSFLPLNDEFHVIAPYKLHF